MIHNTDLQPAFIGCVNILISWFDLELAFGPLIKNLMKTFINICEQSMTLKVKCLVTLFDLKFTIYIYSHIGETQCYISVAFE